MAVSMPDAMQRAMTTGKISDEDVLAMRRDVYPDGIVQPHEAEWLFQLNDACREPGHAWMEFFVEAITDHVVNQVEPAGYVSKDNTDWLIQRIGHKGLVGSSSELELLVNVLDKAKSSPERLVGFALAQVKAGALTGSGPTRLGVDLLPFRIGAGEVDLLRRMLYAFGGDGNLAITRTEAELLFDINDVVGNADNHPSWSDLFVKAIANFLMAASGYEVPPRREALRLEDWRDDDRVSVVDFFGRALTGGLRGILASYSKDVAWQERLKAQERDVATGELITESEARWLMERIARAGGLHENERQLLSFIAGESPDVHPLLRPLLEQAA